MDERTLPFPLEMPEAGTATVVALLFVFILLLCLAVGIELVRRRRLRRERIEKEWRHVEDVVESKDLSMEEWRLLRAIIERYAAGSPLEAVTERRRFNECVSAYMDNALKNKSLERCEEEGELLRSARERLALDFIPAGQRITSTREVVRGQRILASPSGEHGSKWFHLTATDVTECFIYASAESAVAGQGIPEAPKGSRLKCRMWREDDARYAFDLELAQKEQGMRRLKLLHAKEIRRIQARAYFRVRVNQPVTVTLLRAPADGVYENLSKLPAGERIRCRVTSLSAGGLALEAPRNISGNHLMRLVLDLHDGAVVMVHARVVGSSPLAGGAYLVRGTFVDIEDKARDAIARYVWRRQQPLIRQQREA